MGQRIVVLTTDGITYHKDAGDEIVETKNKPNPSIDYRRTVCGIKEEEMNVDDGYGEVDWLFKDDAVKKGLVPCSACYMIHFSADEIPAKEFKL